MVFVAYRTWWHQNGNNNKIMICRAMWRETNYRYCRRLPISFYGHCKIPIWTGTRVHCNLKIVCKWSYFKLNNSCLEQHLSLSLSLSLHFGKDLDNIKRESTVTKNTPLHVR